MPAHLERINFKDDESFSIGIFQDTLEKCTWHYHNNYEISFITEGTGRRIVGDSMMEFQPGDLVFIGKNLPHVWIAEKEFRSPSNRFLEMVYIQFTDELLGPQMLSLPEFRNINIALVLSEKGIQITGNALNEVSEIMLQLPYLDSFERMIGFLRLMDRIGASSTNIELASPEYVKMRIKPGNKRISVIHEYLMNNFHEDIDLDRLAKLVNLAKGSLCRFFKMNTGATLVEYLNRIRVDLACKLLMDPDISITEAGFDSGFNSISHFNKQFRKITGLSPTRYRKEFRSIVQDHSVK